MKQQLTITDNNGTRSYDSTDVQDLRDAAALLLQLAAEHEPGNTHKATSAAQVQRVDLVWEA